MWRKKHERKAAVGFFREDGKTKPVTKSVAELNRKKIVQNPRSFQGINPQFAKINSNIQRCQRDASTLDQHIEKQTANLEAVKAQFQESQQDPQKALRVEKQLRKTVFIIGSLTKKRARVQARLQELEKSRTGHG